jgi:hypothetical protein
VWSAIDVFSDLVTPLSVIMCYYCCSTCILKNSLALLAS